MRQHLVILGWRLPGRDHHYPPRHSVLRDGALRQPRCPQASILPQVHNCPAQLRRPPMRAPLPSFWHLILGLQRLTNATILTSRTWGTEEALETLLCELPQHEGALVPHILLQRFTNLRRNRTAKHRHRQHMLAALACDAGRKGAAPTDPADMALQHECLHQLWAQATQHEWYLLEALAAGHTYAEMAASQGITVACCKTQVCRLRQRLVRCAEEWRKGSSR